MDIKKALARCVPKVGMRNIKTAIAAALCAVVYYAWGPQSGLRLHRRDFWNGE